MLYASIEKVSERKVRTRAGWKVKYDVLAASGNGSGYRPSYETWSMWHASLCDRAAKTGRRVLLGLRETRWGFEIVSAELEGLETVQ